MAIGRPLEFCDHVLCETYQIERHPVLHQPPCLQTYHIEQIVSEPSQAIGA